MIWIGWVWAADWSDQIDTARQGAILDALTGVVEVQGRPIRSRHIFHADHDLARARLLEELHSIDGLEVEEETFTALGVLSTNLIATLPGADSSLAPLVVSAHYDSTAVNTEGFDPELTLAPGADDDGSGVVAILEIARLFSQQQGFERTIEFILFDAEEEGLLGSVYHVDHLSGDVYGMMSLDSVGANPTGLLFVSVGIGAEHLQTAFEDSYAEQTVSHVEQLQAIEAALLGAPRSDHGPFMAAGFPAVHVAAFPLPPTYHTSDDARDVVDPVFVADATAIVAGALAKLAVPVTEEEPEPDPPGCGCEIGRAFALPQWLLRRRR